MHERSLEDLLERMSTRERIDWQRAEASADSPASKSLLGELSQLDAMARFYADRPLPVDDAETTQVATGAGSAVATAGSSSTATWGNLRLLERMGSGAFGEVHRAWDPQLNRQVALKLLHRAGDAAVESMLEEARLLARVEHPNVVRVHGAQTHDGRPGIWMEFVEGTTLAQLAEERGTLSPREVVELGSKLCDALEAIHAAGVVHQDIKLQNILLRPSGEPVLMDFGAGRRRQSASDPSLSISGTPRYLAPELLDGGAPSPQSDLWSLGVVLFRLVSGGFPVDGKSVEEIFAQLRARQRQSLTSTKGGLPARLIAVIERALDFDPRQRFAGAAEMRSALRASLQRRTRPIWLLAAALVVVVAAFLGRQLGGQAPLSLDAQWSAIAAVERPLVAGDTISPQEQLRLRLRLNRDAHVYILNRDETGSTTLLYPTRDAGDASLQGQVEHWIPGAVGERQLAWTLSAQAGLESFLIVASVQPLLEFERELARLAAVDLGSGVVVRPMAEVALNTLTRGVTGVREVASAPQTEPAQDVFDLAREMAMQEQAQPTLRLSMFVLRNSGE